jgi:ribosomal protein L11 methyltransferase
MESAPPLWKASIMLAKSRSADAVAVFELAPPKPQAVLISEDPFGSDAVVEALYDREPDAGLLSRLFDGTVTCAPLPDQDWIRQSQLGLAPVRTGRFFLYGTHDKGRVPYGAIPIRIEAGLAFGTGHHETTALCLKALSDIARASRPAKILDLGCGTGVLAIAAAKLWHRPVTATDIDPVAVDVARGNARSNATGPFIRAAAADGLDHPAIREAKPFDLILANILARPLTHLAPAVVRALAPGGTAVLSGLLRNQEELVLSYYRALGLVLRRTLRQGPWSALVITRAKR